MFSIVESACPDPVRMMISPKGTRIKPGHIVKTKYIEGSLHCELSDGYAPFGITGEMTELDMIKVYPQRMVFRTTTYQSDKKYKEGCALYTGKNGILTSEEPFKDALCVARMITPPNASKIHLEALWL